MSTTAASRPQYGNWVQRRSPGIGSIGLIGSVILLAGLVVPVLVMVFSTWQAAVPVAVFFLVAFTLVGTPLGSLLTSLVVFHRQADARENQWRSGVFTRNKNHQMRLPGMLGTTTLLSKSDAFGNEFAVVKSSLKGSLYTVVARCVAEGPSLQDQERIDGWVASYGGLLAACGQEPALVCAKAIVDTAPDVGGRLGASVRAVRSPASPQLARDVMDEVVRTYPAAASSNITYIELTFRGRGLSRLGREDEILAELARRVPTLLGRLEAAGGGGVEMVGPRDLAKIVYIAYNPAAARFEEEAELAGLDEPIPWHEAGPVGAQATWDHYRHDSGVSVTWEMTRAPRAKITERALASILEPHGDFVRKRVALVYRPHSPDEAMQASENDSRTANFTATTSSKRPSAAASMAVRATEQARHEVASGAGLVRFSILVTATVASASDLPQAVATVESRAGAVPIKLRRSYGSQGAAFAATMPVGFVPWAHTVIPAKVREWL
ncbi:SCO6880 family protein [Pengzhenrongella sp.]|jgi:hypothetical protein|uniref:SCO6880 family protein n=1 Tax=Pengzhenrongella sp. TaxID=2888820 RepID=UPI002F93C43C